MKIINHRLCYDDETPYPYQDSPNHSGTYTPRYLVMHYTAGSSSTASINWLTNPQAKASAHIVIGREGDITQLVPFNVISWHAGRSAWQGLSSMNRYSIGIEMDNAGVLQRTADGEWVAWFGDTYGDDEVIEAVHKNESQMRAWQLYTPEQLYAALEVAAVLVEHYNLQDVIGHDDIAPGRKSDPGPAFPMTTFRSRLFGRTDDENDTNTYATTVNLNIRVGPGLNHSPLDVSPLPGGTQVTTTGDEEGDWKEVEVAEIKGEVEVQGWVHGRYLRRV